MTSSGILWYYLRTSRAFLMDMDSDMRLKLMSIWAMNIFVTVGLSRECLKVLI